MAIFCEQKYDHEKGGGVEKLTRPGLGTHPERDLSAISAPPQARTLFLPPGCVKIVFKNIF